MQSRQLYLPLKILGYGVLTLMAVAMGYAFSISLIYWAGIGV